MSRVLSVNLARPMPNPAKTTTVTGIDKVPTDAGVLVRAPGPMRGGAGSGLSDDVIGNQKLHGGDDQAVYAYAREDLDRWQTTLDRPLANGNFGENLTTCGVDVTGAVIGERWRIGTGGLLLEVTSPRTPCRTFASFLGVRGWMGTFTRAAVPGAYLRVLQPGTVQAGDEIEVVDRPDSDITVGLVFRAISGEAELLPRLVDVAALPEAIRKKARKRSPVAEPPAH